MNAYLTIGVPVLAFALGGWLGYDYRGARCEAQIAKMVQESQGRKDAEADKAGKASIKLEVEDAKARIVYRTITKTVDRLVDRPVYRDVCLDPDGLRLARAALAGESPDPGQPNNPVPEPAATGKPASGSGAASNR